MKKLTFWKSLFLLFALIVGNSNGWGQTEYSYSFTSNAWTANGDRTLGDVTWTLNMTGGTISTFSDTQGLHFGTNNNTCSSVEISTSGISGTITSISVEASRGSSLVGELSISVGGNDFSTTSSTALTTSNATYTFTGSESGDISILWTKSSGKGAFYIKSISVTYTTSGGNTPSISAENVPIAYNATNGSIAYTINNGVNGGALTAAIKTGTTPTIGSFTVGAVSGTAVAFTCTANSSVTAKTATVTLTYTYDTDKTVTKDVTITQAADPNAFNSITDITASGTSYKVKGTVVATNARGFVTGDGTGYIYYYKGSDAGKSVGDILSIDGTTGTYGQVLQFTSSATIAASETSNYNETPAATVVTAVPDYSSGLHLSTYLQFEGGLTKSGDNYFITLGDDNIQISYPTTAQATTLGNLVSKTVSVKGYFTGYNSSNYFTVMLESVEEVVSPVIVTSSTSLTDFTYEVGNGPSAAKSFTVEGSNLTENITLSLGESSYEMSLSENSDYTDELSLAPTTGAVASTTIYVRLKAGLAVNASYSGNIALTSTGATAKAVSLSGSVTQPTLTWDLSTDQTTTASDDEMTWVGTFATMAAAKADATTNTNNYYPSTPNQNYTSTRFYKSSNLTIAPTSGYAITSVEFSATTKNFATALNNSTWSNASASMNETTFVVTITPTNGALPISATIGSNCGFTEVKVYYEAANTVTLTPAKAYTTLTSSHNLDFTSVSDDLKAYIATEIADSKVKMTQVNKVPAGTGLVLKATTPNTAVDVPVFDGTGADEVSGNKMAGSATTITAVAANGGYILSDGIFQPASKGNLAAGKAYLDIEVASARALEMSFDDTTTGINGVEEVAPVTKTRKVVKNGRLVIETANGEFTIDGARMK